MRVIISTTNQAKIKAVEEVFNDVWKDVEFFGCKSDSGISQQPLSEEEGIDGALNRAKGACRHDANAEFWIGLEGYVDSNEYGMFLAGAVVIISKDGRVGYGTSAKVLLPDDIKKEIEAGAELGPLIKKLMNDVNGEIRHSSGTNGVLTKGLYTRVDEFKDAVKCALARFVSPEFY